MHHVTTSFTYSPKQALTNFDIYEDITNVNDEGYISIKEISSENNDSSDKNEKYENVEYSANSIYHTMQSLSTRRQQYTHA